MSRDAPTEKACTTCGVTQSIYRFHKSREGSDGRHRDCKLCRAGKRANPPKPEYATRAEYMRARRAKYRALNPLPPRERKPSAPKKRPAPEVARAQALAWRRANPERVRATQQRRYAKRTAEGRRQQDILSASYVAASLGLSVKLVPETLIAVRRAQIQLSREIRSKSK